MDTYNLCLSWNWEYDFDFASLVAEACSSNQSSLLQVTDGNLAEVLDALTNHRLSFQVLIDRASDQEPSYTPLARWAMKNCSYYINHYDKACISRDKAEMHYSLIHVGLHTPYTTILPSFQEKPDLSSVDLRLLGIPFTIKPAHGGGGDGVVTEACHFDQVLAVRREYPDDKYLLQANIVPRETGPHSAWFRVIYCTGEVYPCWWDRGTHHYTPVSYEEEQAFGLLPLREATTKIASLTCLDLFSTEIALTDDGRFIVVDYVNDMLDLRLQSKAADGIPDGIVADIARRLVLFSTEHFK